MAIRHATTLPRMVTPPRAPYGTSTDGRNVMVIDGGEEPPGGLHSLTPTPPANTAGSSHPAFATRVSTGGLLVPQRFHAARSREHAKRTSSIGLPVRANRHTLEGWGNVLTEPHMDQLLG
jgi:hypothetical protein